MAEVTPRVTAPYLQNFQGQTIRLLGKVTQLRGDTATVDAGGAITVILNRVSEHEGVHLYTRRRPVPTNIFDTYALQDAHLTPNHAVEIVGKVMNNLHVKVLTSTDFGTSVDFAAADAVVDMTHRYKEIFYSKDE